MLVIALSAELKVPRGQAKGSPLQLGQLEWKDAMSHDWCSSPWKPTSIQADKRRRCPPAERSSGREYTRSECILEGREIINSGSNGHHRMKLDTH